jgi:hypothetical protein
MLTVGRAIAPLLSCGTLELTTAPVALEVRLYSFSLFFFLFIKLACPKPLKLRYQRAGTAPQALLAPDKR